MTYKVRKLENLKLDSEFLFTQTKENKLGIWSLEDYRNVCQTPDYFPLFAEKYETINNIQNTKKLVGFILCQVIFEEVEILNICVHKDFRKKGIGRILLDALLVECIKRSIKKIWLEVRESNFVAIKLYEQFGFIYNSKRKNYYSNPIENALAMLFEIEKKPHKT